jgi:diguanylate cyclase (GGDEF)-like protein
MDALRSKVLAIDDDEAILMLFDTILPKEGFSVVSTPRGGTGITMAHDEKPDLIILDLGLPDIPGMEVCRVMRQDPAIRHIPILMLTAQNNVQDKVKGLELGADDYIGKPFSPAIVKARVSNLARFVRQRKLLETLAGRDGLTEIPNRRAFDQALLQEIARSLRNGQNLSLALIDVDFFKRYNDCYGHLRGDICLKQVAATLQNLATRPGDIVARYGGEEFIILLIQTDHAQAMETAERIRADLAAQEFELTGKTISITSSFGVSTFPQDATSAQQLVRQADQRLYRAKEAGRNRVKGR